MIVIYLQYCCGGERWLPAKASCLSFQAMSVNNPSDSGGGGGSDVAFANPPSMTEMDMGTMGAWAEIMAEEQVQAAPANEKNDESEIREQNKGDVDDGTRKAPDQQNFAVQVTNLPPCTDEELFYYFGGDKVVRDVKFLKDYAAQIDLHTAEGLKSAKELNGQQFRGRTLRVYEIREDRIRERPSQQDLLNRQYSNPPPYSRDNSRYNSQSSLYSNDARSYERSNRSYNNSNDYRGNAQYRGAPMGGTFPRGGKFYNNHDDYNNMGRYIPSGGQPYRGNGPYYHNAPYGGGGYAPRSRGMQNRGSGYSGGRGNYYGSQELQRSDSYHHDEREKPGPISRSRTESTAFDTERRRVELSRTSSRLSTSTEDMEAPRVAPKKLTNKDIFGEAKPVDTSERLREIEAKQERERLLEQQKYKVNEEAEAARSAAAAEHPEGGPPHQYGGHHGHVARDGIHHAPHHQYHHAPSRPPIPPHATYGSYHAPLSASQHPQQPYANATQFHPQQRYEPAGPGSYRIMRRESTDATDASPPLDPIHAKAPLQSQNTKESDRNPPSAASGEAAALQGRRDSGPDRRRGNDANTSGSDTLPRPAVKQRVVYNSNNSKFVPLQKSATIGEIRDAAGPQRYLFALSFPFFCCLFVNFPSCRLV
ncbi:Bindin [Trichostrongylus colubriformis]|uniref:Bindin n=1 Tax=Trichostrongylus colubriformis TaxID=6319 RepID=A0AAN8FD53_TRICO